MIIIQFMPTTVTTGLLTLAPEKLVDYRLFNIILLFAVRLIVFAGIILIKNKIDYSSIQTLASVIPNYVYFLIILVLFLSEGLNQTSNYITSNIEQKIELIKILSSLQTICTTVIILSLLFNVISKKYQSDINTVLEKQIATQLYHYEQLEKMNAETRRFKHDYINHMKCISYMALNQEYDNILNYIGKLSAAFPTSSFLFETGNYIADAILTEKQVSSPDNISIQFDGVIPTDIDNTDLCIILSNAVDNAVEACCLLGGDKIINVYGGFKHGYFVFKIKNPTVNTNLNGKITTTKSDKINHGFGLDNIKRALKKYDGYLSTSCEDNVFTLNITFSGLSDLPPKTRENNSAEAEKVEK
ncbi:MAG: GHKL domain-containing protein [Ruminococcus sp.]|nr:GHKL domain-containing protein [Ruminococcus sp.]